VIKCRQGKKKSMLIIRSAWSNKEMSIGSSIFFLFNLQLIISIMQTNRLNVHLHVLYIPAIVLYFNRLSNKILSSFFFTSLLFETRVDCNHHLYT